MNREITTFDSHLKITLEVSWSLGRSFSMRYSIFMKAILLFQGRNMATGFVCRMLSVLAVCSSISF